MKKVRDGGQGRQSMSTILNETESNSMANKKRTEKVGLQLNRIMNGLGHVQALLKCIVLLTWRVLNPRMDQDGWERERSFTHCR
jgi:hypothetical protein